MINILPYDILNELSYYFNNNSKIKLEKSSKYLEELIYIYIIDNNSKKLNDNILKQNKFKKLIILNARNNKNITTCEPFKDTLIKLYTSYGCGINNNGLKNCNKIQILDARFNEKITTCEPFKDTLIELNANGRCGINDNGLKNCNKIQILNASNNGNITICEPFKDTLIELNASWQCGINDEGLQNCNNLKKIYVVNNLNITTYNFLSILYGNKYIILKI